MIRQAKRSGWGRFPCSTAFKLPVPAGTPFPPLEKQRINYREPQFHLLQPRRVSRGEVEPDFRIPLEELLHHLGLVRR